MDEQEFISSYCKNSNIKQGELLKNNVVLPCNCGQGNCKGFAVVINKPAEIKAHNDLYR